MHTFLLGKDAEALLPPDIVRRVAKKKGEVGEQYEFGHWSRSDVRRAVEDLIGRGYFEKGKPPRGHTNIINDMFENSDGQRWRIGGLGDEYTEAMHDDDILLLGGIIAADILTPDEFWAEIPGFSGPSDVQSTIGIMAMKNRDVFFERGGYTWESVEGGHSYASRISGSMHGDLRIERVRTSHVPTVDPFGKTVHYKPVTSRERQLVVAYHSCETTLLAAALKYVDQERPDVPCLADNGQALLADTKAKGQFAGNFADFGQGGMRDNPNILFFEFAFPMEGANEEKGLHWHLSKEFNESAYRIHIDDQRRLAFTNVDKEHNVAPHPALAFPAEEMDHVIRGIFTQAQQGKGRTSVAQLAAVLAHRYSDGFDAEMKRLRVQFLGHE